MCDVVDIHAYTKNVFRFFLSHSSVSYHKKKSLNFFTLPINLFNWLCNATESGVYCQKNI